MQHVDEGRLHAWLDGELPGPGAEGAQALERHLEDCGACRARADEERRIRDAAAALLRRADPGEHGTPRVIPLSVPAAAPARRGDRRWVAVGWAASVLLALGVGWLARPAAREQVAIDAAPAVAPRAPRSPAAAPAAGTAADAGLQAPTTAPAATSSGAPAAAEPPAGAAPATVQAAPPPGPPPGVEGAVLSPEPEVAQRRSVAARSSAPAPMPASPPPPPPPPAAAPMATPAYAPQAPAPTRERIVPSEWNGAAADAATVTVRGQVTDDRGRPLRGVQVSVPGLAARTVTGADGSYALSLPASRAEGDTVTVRAQQIGMRSQARALLPGRTATLDFALAPATVAMEGLVVTGSAPPPAAASLPERPAAESVAWRGVDRAEAERRLGRPLVTVPQLPLLGIELAQAQGGAAVRVRQRLQDGAVLSLVQRRAPGARGRRRDALTRAATEVDGSRIVLEARGLVVEASAPLSPDSLRQLLAPVREP